MEDNALASYEDIQNMALYEDSLAIISEPVSIQRSDNGKLLYDGRSSGLLYGIILNASFQSRFRRKIGEVILFKEYNYPKIVCEDNKIVYFIKDRDVIGILNDDDEDFEEDPF